MSKRANADLSDFVAGCIRHAARNGNNYMLGYCKAQRQLMQCHGTFSLRAYLAGWRLAAPVQAKEAA